jgi:hypothetical protein
MGDQVIGSIKSEQAAWVVSAKLLYEVSEDTKK